MHGNAAAWKSTITRVLVLFFQMYISLSLPYLSDKENGEDGWQLFCQLGCTGSYISWFATNYVYLCPPCALGLL